MDEKILSALSNLANSLDAVAEALSDKSAKSDTALILLKVDNIDKRVEALSKGVKSIKEDTQKIIKNQETLIAISKEKKSEIFEVAGDRKAKIKDGVGIVVLIAAGVLAIGTAFKLIGTVDFTSVLALSLSLPLVAISFERIAKMKDLTPSNMRNLFFVIVTMAASLTAASLIMSFIHPISISQGLTALLISGTFALIGYNIEKIIIGVKKITPFDLIKLPLVLVSIATAISLSSQIMRLITPISISQGLTAILVAGSFAVISYGIERIANGIKNIKPTQAILMPLILVSLATAITLSSNIFQKITPITVNQGLTAIAIATTLTLMSLALPILSKAVRNTSIADAFLMTAILPLLGTAIWLSSIPLSKTTEISPGLLLNIVLQSLALGISSVIMGGAIWLFSKMGLGLTDVIQGGLSIVTLASTIMLSSLILTNGDYSKYPSIEWTIGTGLSLVAFGVAAAALGLLATTGVGALALVAGGIAIIGLSGVIVESARILSNGKYNNYPNLSWSSGVALSLAAFGMGVMALGALIIGSFGAGLLVLSAGSSGILTVSQAIVDSSIILQNGIYSGGPTVEWADGVSRALSAFAPIFKVLYDKGILNIFSSGPSAEDFANAITTVSNGIVTAGNYFKSVPNIWKGGPTVEWASGVGGALSAFAPVFKALSDSSGIFSSGITPEDFANAITTVSNGIVTAGNYFIKYPNIWKGGPTTEWSNGISSALSAFAPIFDYLSKNNGWFSNPTEDLQNAIRNISNGIVMSSQILANGNYTNSIPDGYLNSLSNNIRLYVNLIEFLQSKNIGAYSFIDTLSITWGISKLSEGYNELSKSIKSLGTSIDSIDIEKLSEINKLTGNVILMSLMDSEQFEKMMDSLESKAGIFVSVIEQLEEQNKTSSVGTIGSIKTSIGSKANEDDILRVLNSIDTKMSIVANSCNTFVSYMNQLRVNNVGNNSIRSKKHI